MIRRIIRDERGSVIIENTITMLVFVLLTMGITQAGLIMWSAVGLQHGVEMAARCASVSDAAIAAGFSPSATTPTICGNLPGYTANGDASNASNTAAVQLYAAENSWGLSPTASNFSVSTSGSPSCSTDENIVKVSNYTINLMNFLLSVRFTPQSCYATN
jgi:Flp pilus assembly protein TadG